MKKNIYFTLLIFLVCVMSCKKEICRTCVRCISYDANNKIINEVKKCYIDTASITNYKQGFIEGAASVGRSAICFDLGIECECE